MKQLMKNKNFMLLFNGALVSSVGDVLFNFAIGLYILDLTHSALMLSLYGMIGSVTWLIFAPLGGVWVDRLDRVKVIYMTDFIRGFAVLSSGIIMLSSENQNVIIAVLYLTAMIIAINGALFGPALQSVIPMVVKKDQLLDANAALSLMYNVKDVFGMLLAGLLYAMLGPVFIVFLNGCSYIISALTEMWIKVTAVKEQAKVHPSVISDLKEGFYYIFKRNQAILILLVVMNLKHMGFSPIQGVLLPFLMNEHLQVHEMHLSVMYMMSAVGGVLGSLFIAKLTQIMSVKQVLTSSFIVLVGAISVQAIAFVGYEQQYISYGALFILLASTFLLSGAVGILSSVPIITMLQKVVDEAYYGRVMALFTMISSVSMPISTMIGGWLIDVAGIVMVYVLAILVLLIGGYSCRYISNLQKSAPTSEVEPIHQKKKATI